ncbi:MAG: methyltransferase domain-containing protein [Bdellovibrionales bacterium]|nr:methyltransferase domain-containing protein [Bdellovibrionales bacterium]
MFRASLPYLRCPKPGQKKASCGGLLSLISSSKEGHRLSEADADIRFGTLTCQSCRGEFPILGGVAILVPDVRDYLLQHVKGISKAVAVDRIPKPYRREFIARCAELEEEHIEEDLESERVNSLYLMNHYLRVKGSPEKWWKGSPASESPEVTDLIERLWDQGPMEVVSSWIPRASTLVELGCGVGGLFRRLPPDTKFYLGVDSSFYSILLARHINLGTPFGGTLHHPKDLLFGNSSAQLKIEALENEVPGDFIVGEMEQGPLAAEAFDGSVSLNAIDMLESPRALPEAQFRAVRKGGFAIQSGPYIWHERISRMLRTEAPKTITDSSSLVEWLYKRRGFQIEKSRKHIPWLFFKHLRQIELYSVHAFFSKKV